jgi:hypothetical protein
MIEFDKRLIEMFNVRPERYQKFEKALTTDLIYESSPESYNSSTDHP